MKNIKSLLIIIFIIIMIVGGVVVFKHYNSSSDKIDNKSNIVEDDLISYQSRVDEILKKEIKNKKNTIKNPYILTNPYKISPLTSIVIFYTKYSTGVTYTVNDIEYKIEEKTKEHVIPIYYLYADTTNKIKIKTSKETKTIEIKTEKLPDNITNMEVKTNKNTSYDGYYFQVSPDGVANVGYDYEGNVIWYLEGAYYGDMQILDNGHFLLNNGISNGMMGQATGIDEMDLLGKVYKEYLIDGGVHHEVQVLDNGNYLIAGSNPESTRVFDYLSEIDSKTGKVVKTIDLYKIVKEIDSDFASTLSDIWAWNNSAYIDNGNLILSLRNKSSIISIDYNTEKLNWIFGKESNWSSKFKDYMLNSLDGVYSQGQHTASLKDGKLMVFDNGYSADLYLDSKCIDMKDNYSSVKIFEINGKNISLYKEYNTDEKMFSYALSSVFELSNGNKLINFGWEFDESKFEDENCTLLSNPDLKTRLIEVDKDYNIIFDGRVKTGKYRGYKYNFDTNKNYEIIEYTMYDNYAGNYYKELKKDEVKALTKETSSANLSVDYYKGYIKVNALLDEKSELYYIFESIDGEKNYRVNVKEKDKPILITSYLPNLSGKYNVYYVLDGKTYKYDEMKEFN